VGCEIEFIFSSYGFILNFFMQTFNHLWHYRRSLHRLISFLPQLSLSITRPHNLLRLFRLLARSLARFVCPFSAFRLSAICTYVRCMHKLVIPYNSNSIFILYGENNRNDLFLSSFTLSFYPTCLPACLDCHDCVIMHEKEGLRAISQESSLLAPAHTHTRPGGLA
jgi:hypothetical protein